MVRFTAQFIEIKRSNTFLDSSHLTHETSATGSRKTSHDDSEIKANFDSVRNWSKGEEMLRYGQELERDRFRYEVLYKGRSIRQVIEQNPIAYQNDSEKLDKSPVRNTLQRPPNALMRNITSLHLCRR